MPWANAHRAWDRLGSPVTRKNGRPAQSSTPGAMPDRSSGPPVARRYRFGFDTARARYAASTAATGLRRPGRSTARCNDVTHHEERSLDERGFHRRLVGEVLVDRRRSDAELVAQPSHGEGVGALGFEHLRRGVDHRCGTCGACRCRRWRLDHAATESSRNTGCFGAMASSLLVARVRVDPVEEHADLGLPAFGGTPAAPAPSRRRRARSRRTRCGLRPSSRSRRPRSPARCAPTGPCPGATPGTACRRR